MFRMDRSNGHNNRCSNRVFKVYAFCHHCSTVHEVPHRLGSTMLCLSNSSLSNTIHHSLVHHHPTEVNIKSTIFQGDNDIHDNDDSPTSNIVYEQREIIDINGVGRLYPFKISVSPKNKSTLFQQDTTWTCGPYTVVKVVQTILRLHFDEGIPFSGIRANQRLVNEDWLTLGNMKLDIQHTVTPVEGVSQVWNGVATDNDILSYIADTLLISFQDKKCLMELKTKYSDEPNKCWESFTWNITHPLLKKLKRRCVSKP